MNISLVRGTHRFPSSTCFFIQKSEIPMHDVYEVWMKRRKVKNMKKTENPRNRK